MTLLSINFIDNRVIQTKGILVSTLGSLVLESEQYHPVAQTHLHKGLNVGSFPGLLRFWSSVFVQYNTQKRKSAKNGEGLGRPIT